MFKQYHSSNETKNEKTQTFMIRKHCKAAIMLLTTAILLSACGKENTDEGSGSENTKEEQLFENSDQNKTAEATDTAGSNDEIDTALTVINHNVICKIDGKEKANGVFPEILLSEELKAKYPKLQDRITEMNSTWSSSVQQSVAEYATWAAESDYLEDPVFTSQISVTINRFDDRMFSLLVNYYDDGGGAHPNHYSTSTVIDPVNGENLKLSSVLKDDAVLAPAISATLEKNYPGILEEVNSFYFPSEGDDPDQFKQKLIDDNYTWYIDEKGLNILFSPYEIASYATGDLEVLLSQEEYPELILEPYKMDPSKDLSKSLTTKDAGVIEVEATALTGYADYGDDAEAYNSITEISNPSWKKYASENAGEAAARHVSLTKTVEDKTDWLDTEVWCDKNGFSKRYFPYSVGNYYYEGTRTVDYFYDYTELKIYDADQSNLLYDLGFTELCFGPDQAERRYSSAGEYVNWAVVDGDVLYISLKYPGYASENPDSGYIAAISLDSRQVLWKSEPLVSNADNFLILDDTIICGYGFTAEPDYIYLLDKHTGDKTEQIKVNSAPSQFEVVGDTLYVATYNTAYEFKIVR